MSTVIPVITLDGPSGTGKGTVCCMLAKTLGWHMLDSGIIYRVMAYAARLKGLAFSDTEALLHLANTLNLSFDLSVASQPRALLDGLFVSDLVRSEACGQDASAVAVIPELRLALLARQRAFASEPGLVTDGRDMGTVVFPDALLKIYLFASASERAKRRYLQLKEKGMDVELKQIEQELAARDLRDTTRAVAPLKPADDAVLIDTSTLTLAEVFQNVLELAHKRLGFCN